MVHCVAASASALPAGDGATGSKVSSQSLLGLEDLPAATAVASAPQDQNTVGLPQKGDPENYRVQEQLDEIVPAERLPVERLESGYDMLLNSRCCSGKERRGVGNQGMKDFPYLNWVVVVRNEDYHPMKALVGEGKYRSFG